MDPALFDWLLELCGPSLTREDTNLRNSIAVDKRLGIILHWLGHGFAGRQLANLYDIGASTVNAILHNGVAVLRKKLVTAAIQFPRGEVLKRDIAEFCQLFGLQQCAGLLDGTFRGSKSLLNGVITTGATSLILQLLCLQLSMHEENTHLSMLGEPEILGMSVHTTIRT